MEQWNKGTEEHENRAREEQRNMIRYKKSSDEMNRGLKVYKDNRKRGTVKLRGKIGTNIQRNRGIHGQKNGWKEKRRNIKTEGGPEDKPSPLHSISKRRSGLMLIALDSGSRGTGSRGSGSRGPGSRGPGSRGPNSIPGRSTCRLQ